MIFYLVLVLIGALLLIIVGINIIQQRQAHIELQRRNEFIRQRAIIEESESILSNSAMLHCSINIILVLYKRINDALTTAIAVANPSQKNEYERRQLDIASQIEALSLNTDPMPSIEDFQLPDNDKQILMLVQSLKKLKAILRAENNRGRVTPDIFIQEERRIDSLQMKINVESMLSRARSACENKQYGSAKQMVSKALNTLNSIKTQSPEDPFIAKKLKDTKTLLAEIIKAHNKDKPEPKQAEKKKDDIEDLFKQKKW